MIVKCKKNNFVISFRDTQYPHTQTGRFGSNQIGPFAKRKWLKVLAVRESRTTSQYLLYCLAARHFSKLYGSRTCIIIIIINKICYFVPHDYDLLFYLYER
jgi:hypothetical protein